MVTMYNFFFLKKGLENEIMDNSKDGEKVVITMRKLFN